MIHLVLLEFHQKYIVQWYQYTDWIKINPRENIYLGWKRYIFSKYIGGYKINPITDANISKYIGNNKCLRYQYINYD